MGEVAVRRNSEKVEQIQNAPAAPPSFHATIDCTLPDYSNLTGSQFFYILRAIFVFQAESVLMYMELF